MSGFEYDSIFGNSNVDKMFPKANPIGDNTQISEFGWNMPSYELGIKSLMSIGNLWAAFKGLNQAKREYEFNKKITEKNLANSTQSYNTAITDRIKARQSASGNMSDSEVNRYIALNQLKN